MAKNRNTVGWRVPKRKQRVWEFFKTFFKPFYKAKEIVFLDKKFADKCIIVSNHANKGGPLLYELNLPVFHASWGAYQMLGNYSSRYHYLRDVLYIQKNGMGKAKATFKAGFEAFFSIFMYKGMKILPAYPDVRLRKTLEYSMNMLDAGYAVSVYPEDSSKGYFDEMTYFFPGFVMLADRYYKKTGEDLPVYPVYYGKKKSKIVVGKPLYVQQFVKEGLDKKEIAEKFRLEVNKLYTEHFKD
jgi:hypothetical protein